MRDLGALDDNIIKEIFKRINSVQYALNAMEMNHALYDGEFISVATNIIESGIFDKLSVLGENAILRTVDLEYITTIMTTAELNGYFSSIKEGEPAIQRFNVSYLNSTKMENSLKEVLQYILDLNLEADSFWRRKTCMFTMMCELMFAVYVDGKKLLDKMKFRELLDVLQKRIILSRDNNGENEYIHFMIMYILRQLLKKQERYEVKC